MTTTRRLPDDPRAGTDNARPAKQGEGAQAGPPHHIKTMPGLPGPDKYLWDTTWEPPPAAIVGKWPARTRHWRHFWGEPEPRLPRRRSSGRNGMGRDAGGFVKPVSLGQFRDDRMNHVHVASPARANAARHTPAQTVHKFPATPLRSGRRGAGGASIHCFRRALQA